MQVKVYPNPSMGLFNVQVQTPGKEQVAIRVIDAQGRLVREMKAHPYEIKVIGSDWSPGAYILEIKQGRSRQTLKIMKE